MDTLTEEPEIAKPDVKYKQASFFETKKGKVTIGSSILIIILFILTLISNYSGFIALPFLPQSDTTKYGKSVPIKLDSTTFGFSAGELVLKCPVDTAACNTQKSQSFESKSILTYKAPVATKIYASGQIKNSQNIAVSEDTQAGKKYFYESVASKDGKSCYTIAYTLPSDAKFGNILDLNALLTDKKIATLGNQTITINNEEANVLIQVRNTPIEEGVEPCSLLTKSPEFFKSF